MRAYVLLANLVSEVPPRSEPLDPNDVKPGWLALGIVVLMCVAVYFLCRSFMSHARNAQKPWQGEDADPGIRRMTPHDRSHR